MAENKNQNPPMVDPIAYRADYNAATGSWVPLQNADVNINQYWDDSSAANYNNPELWWWTNTKYTWETTKNSQVAYNPNLTIDQLDPNYKYWQEAQIANSQQANYIAQRNDNIASALYNAWTTSIEDVENFLNQQAWFFNSNPNERENTKTAIFKRLGDLQRQQQQPEQTEKKDVSWDMQQLLWQEQNKLYGKVTADTWEPMQWIDTLTDGYAINQEMIQSRINKVSALQNMNPVDIANLVASGTTPYGETAMRDWKKMDPEWYAKFEQVLNNNYDQDRINSISHWAAPDETKSFVESVDKNIENDIKNFEKDNLTPDSKEWASYILNIKLETDEAAKTAKEEMLNIQKDIAEIQAQIEDLPRQAREAFKSDVPDYLVQAFQSNNQQRLQRELSKLESRYNAAAEIYKTEVAEKQREAEFDLKKAEHNRALSNDAFDRQYKMTKLKQDSVQWIDWVPYQFDRATNSYYQLDDMTALNQYNAKVNEMIAYWQTIIWVETWWECEGYTDKIAEKTAWVTMLWADWRASTTAAEKVRYATWWGYIDENWKIVYWDADVYDLIPQVWDIAVWVGWPYDTTWWHTMFVDRVWTDANGKINFHYTATNKSSKEWEYTVWYEGNKTLDEFLSNGWVWFWNPYKQAQYNWRGKTDSIYLNPMEPIVDSILSNTSTTVSQRTTLSRFRNSYQKLYKAKEKWYIDALLDQWAIWSFVRWFDLDVREVERQQKNFWEDFLTALMQQLTSAAAKELDWDAYMAFIEILWVIETKLREESWARINKNEWKMDFMQYLPEASDSRDKKQEKLENLEDYLRGYAKQWWITAKDYVPIFTTWVRQYD